MEGTEKNGILAVNPLGKTIDQYPLIAAKYPTFYESVFAKFERDREKPFFWKNGKLCQENSTNTFYYRYYCARIKKIPVRRGNRRHNYMCNPLIIYPMLCLMRDYRENAKWSPYRGISQLSCSMQGVSTNNDVGSYISTQC